MVSVPIGYERPSFPSLFWPLGDDDNEFHASFLYKFRDIWWFTTVWTIIWMTGVYTASAGIILITHYIGAKRRNLQKSTTNGNNNNNHIEMNNLSFNHIYDTTISTYNHYFAISQFSGNNIVLFFTMGMYIVVGIIQGFVAGSIVGILIAAIYTAAQFKMTPWIPFVFSLIITLYNIASSYSFTVQSL